MVIGYRLLVIEIRLTPKVKSRESRVKRPLNGYWLLKIGYSLRSRVEGQEARGERREDRS